VSESARLGRISVFFMVIKASNRLTRSEARMRVELNVPESVREPRMWVRHGHILAMALRPGSMEKGLRRSEMRRVKHDAGEMGRIPRHGKKWVRTDDLHYLSIAILDAALTAACDGTSGEANCPERTAWLTHDSVRWPRPCNAERIAGFPCGEFRNFRPISTPPDTTQSPPCGLLIAL
jgi:hypothetical protein